MNSEQLSRINFRRRRFRQSSLRWTLLPIGAGGQKFLRVSCRHWTIGLSELGTPALQYIDPSISAFFADRSFPVGLGGLRRPAIPGGRIGSVEVLPALHNHEGAIGSRRYCLLGKSAALPWPRSTVHFDQDRGLRRISCLIV